MRASMTTPVLSDARKTDDQADDAPVAAKLRKLHTHGDEVLALNLLDLPAGCTLVRINRRHLALSGEATGDECPGALGTLALAVVGVEIEHGSGITNASVVAVQAYVNVTAEYGHLADLAALHRTQRTAVRNQASLESRPVVYADEESDVSMSRQIIEEARLKYWRRHPNVDLRVKVDLARVVRSEHLCGEANVRPDPSRTHAHGSCSRSRGRCLARVE